MSYWGQSLRWHLQNSGYLALTPRPADINETGSLWLLHTTSTGLWYLALKTTAHVLRRPTGLSFYLGFLFPVLISFALSFSTIITSSLWNWALLGSGAHDWRCFLVLSLWAGFQAQGIYGFMGPRLQGRAECVCFPRVVSLKHMHIPLLCGHALPGVWECVKDYYLIIKKKKVSKPLKLVLI